MGGMIAGRIVWHCSVGKPWCSGSSIPQELALVADLPGTQGPSVALVPALRGKEAPRHEVAHHNRIVQGAADILWMTVQTIQRMP